MLLFYIQGACRFNGRYLTAAALSAGLKDGLVALDSSTPVVLKRQGNAEVIDYEWATGTYRNIKTKEVFYQEERNLPWAL